MFYLQAVYLSSCDVLPPESATNVAAMVTKANLSQQHWSILDAGVANQPSWFEPETIEEKQRRTGFRVQDRDKQASPDCIVMFSSF